MTMPGVFLKTAAFLVSLTIKMPPNQQNTSKNEHFTRKKKTTKAVICIRRRYIQETAFVCSRQSCDWVFSFPRVVCLELFPRVGGLVQAGTRGKPDVVTFRLVIRHYWRQRGRYGYARDARMLVHQVNRHFWGRWGWGKYGYSRNAEMLVPIMNIKSFGNPQSGNPMCYISIIHRTVLYTGGSNP